MKYTELEVLDHMSEQKFLDINMVFFYIETLPNYRSAILPRHRKFVRILIENYGNLVPIAQEFEYSTDGISQIFRKIQTYLHLQYKEFINEGIKLPKYDITKNYVPRDPNIQIKVKSEEVKAIAKSNQVIMLEKLIEDNPEWHFQVKDTKQRELVRYLLSNYSFEEIEQKSGISRDTIYRKVFKRDSNGVFDILNKK